MSELKKIGNSEFEVKYVVKDEELKKANDKALKNLASKVNVKGFRKGKAPIELAKEHISPVDLANQTINESINPAYQAVLKEHSLRPIAQPEVNVTKFDDKEIELTFKIFNEPEVNLGQYKDIKVPLDEVKVSEKEVEEAINQVLNDSAELVLKDGAAAMGDTVVFDFKGYINNKEFDGGSADNYSLVLGSNQFIPGFEEQLVGVTAESKKDIIVTFPEQYIKDLAGKEAKFVCMVHEIKTKKVPELNDEFVKELAIEGVNNVADLKLFKEKELANRKNNEAKQKQFSELLNTIINNATLEIPEKLIERHANEIKENLISQITQNGLTFEQYKEITGNDDNSLNEQFKENALTNLKQMLVLNKIGQVEHLTITRNDVENYYSNVAKQYNMKVEDVKKALSVNEQGIINNLYNQKIERFIRVNNLEDSSLKEETKEDSKTNNENKEEATKDNNETTSE